MKSPQLFCFVMTFITCCVFTWKAETSLGEMTGYIALVISMAVFSKSIISKLEQWNR